MTQKQIIKAAEQAGWSCKIEWVTKTKFTKAHWHITFSTDTHFGQDVCYEYDIEKLSEIYDEVKTTYQNYDVDEEVFIWLGPDGHPANGAPSSIRDLVTDMEEVESLLEELYIQIAKYPL